VHRDAVTDILSRLLKSAPRRHLTLNDNEFTVIAHLKNSAQRHYFECVVFVPVATHDFDKRIRNLRSAVKSVGNWNVLTGHPKPILIGSRR
jgi:hypothetical protein